MPRSGLKRLVARGVPEELAPFVTAQPPAENAPPPRAASGLVGRGCVEHLMCPGALRLRVQDLVVAQDADRSLVVLRVEVPETFRAPFEKLGDLGHLRGLMLSGLRAGCV